MSFIEEKRLKRKEGNGNEKGLTCEGGGKGVNKGWVMGRSLLSYGLDVGVGMK